MKNYQFKMKMLVAGMTLMVLFVGAGTIEAALIISDPNQLIGGNEWISMALGDNLMERSNGVDSVFEKGNGEAYVLFGNEANGVVEWAGWFGTNNISSDSEPGYEAWCEGYINRTILPSGSIPNYVLGFYDDDDGQFALLYSGSTLVFDANVEFFFDIEYDGVLGGLTSLAIGSEVKHTVIVPEPATLSLLCFGGFALLRKRRKRVMGR
jgi:hypothetical protein